MVWAVRASAQARGLAVASVRACGFVNYFGLQRFGSGEGEPTHLAGAALLRGELLQAPVILVSSRHPVSSSL